MKPRATHAGASSVWAFAAGYFLCYVPYSALTKAVSSGMFGAKISGLALLPVTTIVSALTMVLTFSLLGWWKLATQGHVFGIAFPRPRAATLVAGLATGGIIVTTTLAYTFEGVSIPFVMLLMRGGVLVLAPIVDLSTGRRPRWFAWVALLLSAAALLEGLVTARDVHLPLVCALDIALYLVGYFVRLRAMGRLGKTDDTAARFRYFAEEQMVASPTAVLGLALLALVLKGDAGDALREGFSSTWRSNAAIWLIAVGALSQGTGVFGGLVLLDARDHSFCVPLNRASSILAGVLAAFGLAAFANVAAPPHGELIGAALVLAAVLVLSFGDRLSASTTRK